MNSDTSIELSQNEEALLQEISDRLEVGDDLDSPLANTGISNF